MFYYKIYATILDENVIDNLGNRFDGREKRDSIALISNELYSHSNNKLFIYVSYTTRNTIVMGLISEDNRKLDDVIRSFVRKIDVEVSDYSYEETTFKYTCKMMRDAERSGYIDSLDEVLDSFGLDALGYRGYRGCRLEFEECVLLNNDYCAKINDSKCFMIKEKLQGEIERIVSGYKKRVSSHPVHYLIQSDNLEESDDIAQILIGYLHSNNRISSRRYTSIKIEPDVFYDSDELGAVFSNAKGGTVLINIDYNNESETNHATSRVDNLEKICALLKENSNDVLTIMWLPKTSESTKNIIYGGLGYINLVEISSGVANADDSIVYLKLLAKEKGVRTDKKLFRSIEQGKYYLATELNELYEKWYSDKLKTVIFPQYKDIDSVKNKIVRDSPKGNAYDDLMEMIGLERAKNVIKQALDYNKAQKLFSDRGVKFERVSMHMVFSGNPGTAKTSVARLFAQIMKDNEVLTEGRLIECGRADLVGKYVGWTAPIVKKKFKEAKGSVLFIDEAYSLVDGRDGMYGDEAINTIVQEMENNRDNVIVIFAGYPDKMEQFLQKNPGLRSRIAYHVPFDDYNVEDLCSIAELISKKNDLILAEDARQKLHEVFSIAIQEEDFGNGRYVRNVIEKAKMAQASRLIASVGEFVSNEGIRTIVASDIEMPIVKKEEKKYGFCA